jgi:shikimate dehydrogenase
MKRFGVIGHPISHSLSPLLHNTAFSLLGLECTYEAFDIEPSSLAATLCHFKDQEFAGLNVTIPHKETIVRHLEESTDEARATGAVNTLVFEGNRIRGENTDIHGIAASLEEYRGAMGNQLAIVLGAGGSARAVAFTLMNRFAFSEIVIANRNVQRASTLIGDLKAYKQSASFRAIALPSNDLDRLLPVASVVINATPVGMYPAINQSPLGGDAGFHAGQIVMDLIYTPRETQFLVQASRCGARTISGLEMFLHQGARSFEIWLGQRMPLESLRTVITRELDSRQSRAIQ